MLARASGVARSRRAAASSSRWLDRGGRGRDGYHGPGSRTGPPRRGLGLAASSGRRRGRLAGRRGRRRGLHAAPAAVPTRRSPHSTTPASDARGRDRVRRRSSRASRVVETERARALIEAGVDRVVVGDRRSEPERGRQGHRDAARRRDQGRDRLRRAEAIALIEPFATWITTGRPFVTLKLAASLDGKVAAA